MQGFRFFLQGGCRGEQFLFGVCKAFRNADGFRFRIRQFIASRLHLNFQILHLRRVGLLQSLNLLAHRRLHTNYALFCFCLWYHVFGGFVFGLSLCAFFCNSLLRFRFHGRLRNRAFAQFRFVHNQSLWNVSKSSARKFCGNLHQRICPVLRFNHFTAQAKHCRLPCWNPCLVRKHGLYLFVRAVEFRAVYSNQRFGQRVQRFRFLAQFVGVALNQRVW